MDALLQQLIDLVKQTAPQLWEIAIRQVYANMARDAILIFVIAFMQYFSYLLCVRAAKTETDEDSIWSESGFCTFILCTGSTVILVGFFIVVTNIVAIAQALINPEYYAIQVLMALVK